MSKVATRFCMKYLTSKAEMVDEGVTEKRSQADMSFSRGSNKES